jgi:hypothetical protein
MRQAVAVAVLAGLVVATAAGGFAFGQEPMLKVVRDVLASAVTDRQPVEATIPISTGVEQIFYFTELEGGPATIRHVWTWQGRTMATVTLEVKTPRFRTWSSKRIQPEWTGQWRVEAQTTDGMVLSSKDFTIQ